MFNSYDIGLVFLLCIFYSPLKWLWYTLILKGNFMLISVILKNINLLHVSFFRKHGNIFLFVLYNFSNIIWHGWLKSYSCLMPCHCKEPGHQHPWYFALFFQYVLVSEGLWKVNWNEYTNISDVKKKRNNAIEPIFVFFFVIKFLLDCLQSGAFHSISITMIPPTSACIGVVWKLLHKIPLDIFLITFLWLYFCPIVYRLVHFVQSPSQWCRPPLYSSVWWVICHGHTSVYWMPWWMKFWHGMLQGAHISLMIFFWKFKFYANNILL